MRGSPVFDDAGQTWAGRSFEEAVGERSGATLRSGEPGSRTRLKSRVRWGSGQRLRLGHLVEMRWLAG